MKAHELAAKLLKGPNLEVMFKEKSGILMDVSSNPFTRIVDESDAEMTADAEERLGEEVVILSN